MKARDTHCDGRAGFTLLETLLVLLMVGVVTALVMPAVWRRSPQVRVEADAIRIVSALRLTRASAIRRNQEASVFIDTERHTVTSTVEAYTRLDPEIDIRMQFASQERRRVGEGGVRFFPNGQSSGGEIRLRLGPAQARVVVNWTTGHADLSQ